MSIFLENQQALIIFCSNKIENQSIALATVLFYIEIWAKKKKIISPFYC
mgnify:CR=1